MKLLLAPLIVVAFIIASTSLVTAQHTSCKEIHSSNPTAASGYYWINTTTGPVQVYCQMKFLDVIPGGWMRAVYINLTENKTCPQGLNYINVSYSGENYPVCVDDKEPCPNRITKHMCIRSHTDKYSCSSVTFPTHGVPYTKVSGRAQGYQYRYTLAFRGSHYDDDGFRYAPTLNDAYVSGLSVTYGSPREHIWTFAAGYSKDPGYKTINCPCARYPGPAPPPFVGENYFCESGKTRRVEGMRWHLGDPLWDSEGCVYGSNCCKRGGPWFTTTLSQEVSDDIEVRMCHYFDNRTENIGIDLLEIYIY